VVVEKMFDLSPEWIHSPPRWQNHAEVVSLLLAFAQIGALAVVGFIGDDY
jgi:hypothetical protein